MGKFAAIGAFLGASSATAASVGLAATGLAVGTGTAIASGVSASRARKQAAKSAGGGRGAIVGDTPQVEAPVPADEKKETAQRIGRAALIATSPSGVLTTAPTGRRKLLGN